MEAGDSERDDMPDLAGRFGAFDDEEWNYPSLFAQRRIRDVLAHLIAVASGRTCRSLGAKESHLAEHWFAPR